MRLLRGERGRRGRCRRSSAQRGGAEGHIDVAVGIEHVLDEPIEAAAADAVELRADDRALAGDLVAGGAVLGEDGLAASRGSASLWRRRRGARAISLSSVSLAGGSLAVSSATACRALRS